MRHSCTEKPVGTLLRRVPTTTILGTVSHPGTGHLFTLTAGYQHGRVRERTIIMADFSSQFDRFTENAKRSLENAEADCDPDGFELCRHRAYLAWRIAAGNLHWRQNSQKCRRHLREGPARAELLAAAGRRRLQRVPPKPPSARSPIPCAWPKNSGSRTAAPSTFYLRS
jgi:hypothetical protein